MKVILLALFTLVVCSGCASTNHQKSASWMFGVYQAEYYNAEGKN